MVILSNASTKQTTASKVEEALFDPSVLRLPRDSQEARQLKKLQKQERAALREQARDLRREAARLRRERDSEGHSDWLNAVFWLILVGTIGALIYAVVVK